MSGSKIGFTLIEIAITLCLFALVSPVLMTLFSQTNLASTASMYEVMATNLATEIEEQLLDISLNPNSPRLKEIESAANARFTDIIQNPEFKNKLGGKSSGPTVIPLAPTGISLIVSPLDSRFASREIEVLSESRILDSGLGTYYTVKITLTWRLPGDPEEGKPKHNYSSIVFLRREPCCLNRNPLCPICRGKTLFP